MDLLQEMTAAEKKKAKKKAREKAKKAGGDADDTAAPAGGAAKKGGKKVRCCIRHEAHVAHLVCLYTHRMVNSPASCSPDGGQSSIMFMTLLCWYYICHACKTAAHRQAMPIT